MEKFIGLALLTFAITHLVNQVKPLLPETEKAPLIASLVLGLAIAFTIRVDLLELLNFPTDNWIVGTALTGIGLAGGSNSVFDALQKKKLEVLNVEDLVEIEALEDTEE